MNQFLWCFHGCDFNQENEIAKNETIFMLYLKIQNKILTIEKQHELSMQRKATLRNALQSKTES